MSCGLVSVLEDSLAGTLFFDDTSTVFFSMPCRDFFLLVSPSSLFRLWLCSPDGSVPGTLISAFANLGFT